MVIVTVKLQNVTHFREASESLSMFALFAYNSDNNVTKAVESLRMSFPWCLSRLQKAKIKRETID